MPLSCVRSKLVLHGLSAVLESAGTDLSVATCFRLVSEGWGTVVFLAFDIGFSRFTGERVRGHNPVCQGGVVPVYPELWPMAATRKIACETSRAASNANAMGPKHVLKTVHDARCMSHARSSGS